MKIPKFLSPTSLHLWETDREGFFVKYMAVGEHEQKAQTLAMAVGSSFDAYVKSALTHHLFGKCPEGYSLDELLEAQVDAAVMDQARAAGDHVYRRYVACGAYSELLDWICRSDEQPKFEFTLTGEIGGVPMVGKPDAWFTAKGIQVVLDWKVNGYCSNSPTSPKKLYAFCRDTWHSEEGKPTRGGNGPHKEYKPMDFGGLTIGSHWLDDVDKRWADQLSTYSWMLGSPVGNEDIVTCLDQIVAKPAEPQPLLRVAQHRCRISSFWQGHLLKRYQDCWNTMHSGHIFTDLTREESDSRCEVLTMQVIDMDNSPIWAEIEAKKGYSG